MLQAPELLGINTVGTCWMRRSHARHRSYEWSAIFLPADFAARFVYNSAIAESAGNMLNRRPQEVSTAWSRQRLSARTGIRGCRMAVVSHPAFVPEAMI